MSAVTIYGVVEAVWALVAVRRYRRVDVAPSRPPA
jgi:hypothetical protein